MLTAYSVPSVVRALAWSPNGIFLASGSNDALVRLWKPGTGFHDPVMTLTDGNPTHAIFSISWSPENRYLATGGYEYSGVVRIWDTRTPNAPSQECLPPGPNTSVVWSVAWSPDGRLLASGGPDNHGTIRIWQVDPSARKNILLSTYTHPSSLDPGDVGSVAWAPDSTRLVSGSANGLVEMWDGKTKTGLLSTRLVQGQATVFAVAWSPDGQRLASGDANGRVQIWDARTGGPPLFIGAGHQGPVGALAWSPDSVYLASGGNDTTVCLWETRTGQKVLTLREHRREVHALSWSPSSFLASGDWGGRILVWQVK